MIPVSYLPDLIYQWPIMPVNGTPGLSRPERVGYPLRKNIVKPFFYKNPVIMGIWRKTVLLQQQTLNYADHSWAPITNN